MRDKYLSFCHLDNCSGDLMKFGSVGYHFVGYTGKTYEIRADVTFGIYQTGKFINHLQAVVDDNADFGNPAPAVFILASACFYVDDCKHGYKNKHRRFTGMLQFVAFTD